jgi:hypothetical protein
VTEVSHVRAACPRLLAALFGIDSRVMFDDWSGQRVAHAIGTIQQVTHLGVSQQVINYEQPNTTRYVYVYGSRAAERSWNA